MCRVSRAWIRQNGVVASFARDTKFCERRSFNASPSEDKRIGVNRFPLSASRHAYTVIAFDEDWDVEAGKSRSGRQRLANFTRIHTSTTVAHFGDGFRRLALWAAVHG